MAVGESCLLNQEEIMQQLQAAVQAYQGKDLDGAEAIFKQILAVNPKEPNALHLLGCIHKDRGQLQQAVDLIQASIREDGSNPIPFLNLGKILAIAGQHENAAGVFQESLKRNQQIPEMWFCLGNAFKEIEKVEEAKQAYRYTLQLNPAHAGAVSNLGALLTDDGELDEAEQLFSKALEQAPKHANLRINYGKLLAEKDDHAAAIVQYQIALPLATHSPELHYNFANALKEEGEVEEAIASYRKAIEVKPDFAEAYLNLGIVLKEEGEVEEAIASYRKAIEVKPDFADAYFALGLVMKEVGEVEEAIASYRKATEIQSDHEKAIESLSAALIALDRYEEAKNVAGQHRFLMQQGSFLHFLHFLTARSQGAYLNAVDLNNANCINELKYSLLRKLRSWIHVGDWLEDIYDSLYSEMYEAFGIQGLDTTDEVYALKPLQGWLLPAYNSLAFRIYSSRFAVGSDFLRLSGPFSSDINHLSHAGHFYLILSAKFGDKVDMGGRRIEIKLDYGIDALPSNNLCLGFSARVGDDWRRDERSHSYVEMIEDSAGVFVAEVIPESLKELGINEEHFTAEKYKLWDPVETAQHASGMFLFLRSPDHPVNPKGSVKIHSFNVI